MKRIKITLPIAALLIAIVFSAFSIKPTNDVVPGTFTELHWFDVRGPSYVYDGELTKQDEMNATGCLNTAIIECSRGYTTAQLVNGDPAQGPIDPDVFTDLITKTN